MNTCRFCKICDEPLFKYSVRHYAHAECGVSRFDFKGFIDQLPTHIVMSMVYRLCERHGYNLDAMQTYFAICMKKLLCFLGIHGPDWFGNDDHPRSNTKKPFHRQCDDCGTEWIGTQIYGKYSPYLGGWVCLSKPQKLPAKRHVA